MVYSAELDSEVFNGAWSPNPCCPLQYRVWLWQHRIWHRVVLSVQSLNLRCITIAQSLTPCCAVHSAEFDSASTESDTLLRYTVQRVTMRCKTEHGVWIRTLYIRSTESDTVLCYTVQSQTPRCTTEHGIRLWGVQQSKESVTPCCAVKSLTLEVYSNIMESDLKSLKQQ